MIDELIPKLVGPAVEAIKAFMADRDSACDAAEDKVIQKKLDAELARDRPRQQMLRDLEKRLEQRRVSALVTAPSAILDGILSNFQKSREWSAHVSFLSSATSRDLSDVYVPLELYLYAVRIRTDDHEVIERLPFMDLLNRTSRHVAVLGEAGAGKTTSMKFLCRNLMGETSRTAHPRIPIVIRLNELLPPGSAQPCGSRSSSPCSVDASVLVSALISIFRLELKFEGRYDEGDKGKERSQRLWNVLVDLLDALDCILILDGYDELPSQAARDVALAELRRLALELNQSRVVLTCRTGEFNYNIDNMEQFQLAPLSESQIEVFAARFLGNQAAAQEFLKAIDNTPYRDTAIKPLSLAHLCAIYKRKGSIPEKPKTVYRKVFYLLLEEWDEERSVRRTSRFLDFPADRKADFLSSLAYHLTTRFQLTIFRRDHLLQIYSKICGSFDLPETEMRLVIDELESHTGLFLRTGLDSFEFAHKSLQEYLAAEHIVKLPHLLSDPNHIVPLPNELAIAVSLSSDPSGYLSHLVLSRLPKCPCTTEFYEVFLSRLAQEAPVFTTHEPVVAALLALGALWTCNGKMTSTSHPQHIAPTVETAYEHLARQVLSRNDHGLIEQHYTMDKQHLGQGWYRLRRMGSIRGTRLPSELHLPGQLVDGLARACKATESGII